MQKHFKFHLLLLSGCLFCFLAPSALAVSMTGDIDLSGRAKFNTHSLMTASEVTRWIHPLVSSDSGNFASFAAPGDAVAMTAPWLFASSAPFSGLWRVDGFTFDVISSSVVSRTKFSLSVVGTGTVSGNGFDATFGDWSFTYNKMARVCHGRGSFQFDFEAISPPGGTPPPISNVPESGSTLALLGFALVGLFSLRARHERSLAIRAIACDRGCGTGSLG